MPNHIENELEITGDTESLKEILDKYIYPDISDQNDLFLDFQKIIPMPDKLDLPDSSIGHIGYCALYANYKSLLKHSWIPDGISKRVELLEFLEAKDLRYVELAVKYRTNEKGHGYKTWYQWRNRYWGTKWNSFSGKLKINALDDKRLVLILNTAWSPPLPVIKMLSKIYEGLNLSLKYFDEDHVLLGEASFKAGNLVEHDTKFKLSNPYYEEYMHLLLYTGERELLMPSSPYQVSDLLQKIKH